MTFVILALIINLSPHADRAFSEKSEVMNLQTLDRVVLFAIQQEVSVKKLTNRTDLCIAFGDGLQLNERGIISALRRHGVHAHAKSWCNRGPRGLRIGVIAPIRERPGGNYEIVIDLNDLSPLQRGEHFATLIRRGTYLISEGKDSHLKLISYQEACCNK